MITIIAVAHKKGGGTKTTTTINLAGALEEKGKNVKIADFNTEQQSAFKWAMRGKTFQNKTVLVSDKEVKTSIDKIKYEKPDFILMDLPPELTTKALKAIIMANFCLIPCQASTLDFESAEETVEIIEAIQKPFWLFASNVKKGTSIGEKLLNNLKQLGKTLETTIYNRVSIVESAMVGEWVGTYKPGSDEHRQYLKLADEIITISRKHYE